MLYLQAMMDAIYVHGNPRIFFFVIHFIVKRCSGYPFFKIP
jgi:hypothetical protein